MRPKQTVAEMAEEVLSRQAQVHAQQYNGELEWFFQLVICSDRARGFRRTS
jgi:UDP-N-acetylmuramyl pentapeptide synthase